MLTYYDNKRERYVSRLSNQNCLLFESVEGEKRNDCYISPPSYLVYGEIVDRLAKYESLAAEPSEIEEYATIRARLSHLLESDFINSFDEKDYKTKEYKRDIKEADKLMKFAAMKSGDYSATFVQLRDLIADRKSFITDSDDKEHDRIYENDITAIETAIAALHCHTTLIDICNNHEKTIASLKNELEQAKEENKLLKRDMLAKDACIDMQNKNIMCMESKLHRLRTVLNENIEIN